MHCSCVRQTELPHTSRLFLDAIYYPDRTAHFYFDRHHDFPAVIAAARQAADFPDAQRAALVAALREQNPESAALERLAKPGTVAVVTGQQVGLFSGPAYTIYKALTAARLAAQLTERGIPAVPVFWLATEDHDFAEVNHAFVFGADHQPVTLRVNGVDAPEHPVGAIPISDPPIDQFRKALAGLPYASEVTQMIQQTYRPGATFGGAFQALLQRLLAKFGLLFVDPLDEPIRRMAAPVLRKALGDGDKLKQQLLDRNRDLEASGYHAQVHIEQKTSLAFLLEGDRRVTLRRQNGDYVSKDRRYSVSQLIDLAEHLSPNALLRPVVQDYVLPTIAYVGGPAELAYMAQSQVLYDDLLGRMPVMLARSSFTLLDARTAKLMHRYGLPITSFFHGDTDIREHIARQLVPPSLSREFEQTRSTVADSLDRLCADLVSFDATLAKAADKTRAKMLYQLSKIERKTARETLRRDGRATEEASYMCGLIFPEKHLQERFYSILPFIARHGLELMDTLYEHVNLDCPDHRVLIV